jgi:putative nucleotide binding protein
MDKIERTTMNEEKAIVLDFLPQGKSSGFKSEPVAIVLGMGYFTMLEVVPKPGIDIKPLEEVYIGKETRDKIDHIKQRIPYEQLTTVAKAELEKAVEQVILANEKRFLQFFNSSGSISLKRHQLELLPGVGRQHLEDILRARQEKPFESLKEVEDRIRFLTSPLSILRRRILAELEGDQKHYLFVRPPQTEELDRKPQRFTR